MSKGLLKLKRSMTRMRKLVLANRRGEDELLVAQAARAEAVGLTFDALGAIMPFLETRRDILAMMCTCHDLYTAGIPTLLSFGVELLSCADIMSFCSFMFVDLPRRAYGLRNLSLKAAACDQEHKDTKKSNGKWRQVTVSSPEYPMQYTGSHAFLSRFLFKILQHARRLMRLRVDNLEHWLQADPQLITIIADHDSLQTLSLRVYSEDGMTGHMLEHLQSPISKLELTFPGNMIPFTPNWGLTALPDSVQELYLRGDLQPTAMGRQYPQMRILSLQSWHILDAAVLVHMFPGLVECSCSDPKVALLEVIHHIDLLELRQRNRLAHSQKTWNNLEVLRGDINGLYALGFNRYIRVLHVEGFWLDRFIEIVEDTQPIYMSVTTCTDAIPSSAADYTELTVAPLTRLTELHVQLYENWSTVGPRLAGLFKLLQSFTFITHLCIVTTFKVLLIEGQMEAPFVKPDLIWPDSHAQFIAAKCPPSVQYLALQHPDLDMTYWLISRRDDEELPRVERLSMGAGSASWRLQFTFNESPSPYYGHLGRFHKVSDD